jgi:hypothetical protein
MDAIAKILGGGLDAQPRQHPHAVAHSLRHRIRIDDLASPDALMQIDESPAPARGARSRRLPPNLIDY